MGAAKSFNLFVYGTLMNASVFRAVLGKRLVLSAGDADNLESFLGRPAFLDNYKKISPDNTYLYAVPEPQARIRGYVIGPLPHDCMAALHNYEGRNYVKRSVLVETGSGLVKAVAFVGNLKALEHSFGYAFRDPLKQEVLLRDKIERALAETEHELLHTDENLARRAVAELRGDTIRDLVRKHFDAGGISDYAIRHAIKDSPLRDFSPAARSLAAPMAARYLTMMLRQVVFNQLEDFIRRDFRYELDRLKLGARYYERTISSLAALRILNAERALLDMLVADCLHELDLGASPMVNYVRWAAAAADAVYEPRIARREIETISSHMSRGEIPMGAELEFSNIGHQVIIDPRGAAMKDAAYDSFLYFNDFALDILTWKLGGHVDDHHEKASSRPRRGFFELALGSVSIRANLSKPITDDPWVLNQLIHEARSFYDIAPHSVHVSLQLPSQHRPQRDRLLPPEVFQCLLALGGDAQVRDGRPRIMRIARGEIVRTEPTPSMLFSDISRRRSSDADEMGTRPAAAAARYVQQFKFLRLSPHINYEPIIMALKGIQLSLAPGSFLLASQHQSSAAHREAFAQLAAWAQAPTPLSEHQIEAFLDHVFQGLRREKRSRSAHSQAYVSWALSELRAMLRRYNAIYDPPTPRN